LLQDDVDVTSYLIEDDNPSCWRAGFNNWACSARQ